jgi:hypothetical protein
MSAHRLLLGFSLPGATLCLLLLVIPQQAHAEGVTWQPIGQLAGGLPQAVAIQGVVVERL